MFKNITLIGNLTRDFEIHTFTSGKSIGKSAVAVNDRTFDKDTQQWVDGETTFVDLVVFERMMENVVSSLTKGTRVIVTGTLRLRSYDLKNSDGEVIAEGKGRAIEFLVDDIAPSLRFAQATVVKAMRSQGNGGPAPTGDEDEYAL
jgi:single-strand DNA-binding protein